MSGFVVKPVDRQRLEAAIATACGLHTAARAENAA